MLPSKGVKRVQNWTFIPERDKKNSHNSLPRPRATSYFTLLPPNYSHSHPRTATNSRNFAPRRKKSPHPAPSKMADVGVPPRDFDALAKREYRENNYFSIVIVSRSTEPMIITEWDEEIT